MAKRAPTYPRLQRLKLSEIVVDDTIQPRANGLSDDTVDEYTEAMQSGAKFPPLVVYHNEDENRYWLSEGFHRYAAHEKAERTEVECEVRFGDRLAALHNSCGSNRTHGLRRTNADKRRAIALLLSEYPTQSDRWIADAVGCDHKTVAAVRTPAKPEREHSNDCTGEIPQCNRQNDGAAARSEVTCAAVPDGTDSDDGEHRRERPPAPKQNVTAMKSGNDFVHCAQTSNRPSEGRPSTQPPAPHPAQSARLGNRPKGPDAHERLRQGSREYLAILDIPEIHLVTEVAGIRQSLHIVREWVKTVIEAINKVRPEQ